MFMVVLEDCFASVLCMSFRVSCLDERFERWRTIKCRNPDISDSWEFTNGLYLFTGIIWGILGIGIHRIPRNRSSRSSNVAIDVVVIDVLGLKVQTRD
jgi:hypothetical protein